MKVKCITCEKEYMLVRIKTYSIIFTHTCKLYESMYQQQKVITIEVFE